MRDPSILREALAALEQAEGTLPRGGPACRYPREAAALFADPADPVRGNPAGDVTIVEFFDVRCAFCRRLHPELEALIATADPGVRVVMKDLPTFSRAASVFARPGAAGRRAARASYARLQGALLRLRWRADGGRHPGRGGGGPCLDWARLRRDMEDPAHRRAGEANLEACPPPGHRGHAGAGDRRDA